MLNLCTILKNCPKETKLYSPKYGDVWFCGIYKLSRTEGIIYVYTTKLQDGCTRANLEQCKDIAAFYQDGTCGDENFNITTECMLLPSKEERDWSKWKAINTRFNPQSVKKVLKPIENLVISE